MSYPLEFREGDKQHTVLLSSEDTAALARAINAAREQRATTGVRAEAGAVSEAGEAIEAGVAAEREKQRV